LGFMAHKKVVAILEQVAMTVEWLHGLHPKLIHRDLKCSNVLLSFNGAGATIPKLADFGLSKLKQGVTYRRPGTALSTIALSSPCGTRMWMAPELMNEEEEYSETVDVYAFGVTMLEALYPSVSVASESVPKEVLHIELGVFKRPVVPEKSRYADLIRRCIEMDSTKRPLFHEIVAELGVVLAEMP